MIARKRIILTAAGCILVIVIISSCRVVKPYNRPVNATSDQLFRDANGNDTTNISHISWKEFFTDTLLRAMIQQGIDNNLDLRIAFARIQAAAANAKQSNLAFLPSLDANGVGIFQRVPSTQFGFPETYELFLSSNWEADIWGKLKSAKRASLATLLQNEAYQREVRTKLVADIATNYFLLMAYDAQLQITERTVENRKQEVETMKTLKESNVVTGAAVVQSAANRYSVEITIPDLKQQIRITENTLSTLLGKAPDTIYRNPIDQLKINTSLATGVPLQLLANRPDVQEAEFQFRSAFELVNVARTYFYPSFNITASAGLSGTTIKQLFDVSTFFANLTGNLLQPVFDKGVNKQRLAVATANAEEQMAVFRKAILNAGEEVSNALYSFRSGSEKELLRTQQITYLEKSVDYTKELLKYSSATNYTDVLTSEQSLLAAQLSAINDRLQQLTAVVSLYRSLGGGWK